MGAAEDRRASPSAQKITRAESQPLAAGPAINFTPQDIKNQYSSTSFLTNNRVVFNIKGNDHRLIIAVAYRLGVLSIKFIGTHAEYDKVDATTVEMG